MNSTKKLLAFILAMMMLVSAFELPASAAPSAPSKVTATQNTTAIKLSWTKVSGATGYRIYYKLPGDISWRTALKSTASTSHTFKNLPEGQHYTFAVRSYVKSGDKITWGGYKQITTATQTAAPKKLTTEQSTNAIKLTWSKVNSAAGYKIFYKTTASSDWKTALSETTKTNHTFKNLPAGKKYIFAVQSYSKSTIGIFYGNYITIETATKPATPKVTATSTNSSVTLKWNKINGADGYRVYYKNSTSDKWKTAINSTSKTTYTLKSLKENTEYIFAVRSYIKTSSSTILWSGYKEIKHKIGSSNISVSTIINSIYKKETPEFIVTEATPVDLNDPWSVSVYLGLGDPKSAKTTDYGIEEAYFSESMIGSQAYSLVVAKVKDVNNTEKIKQEIFNGIDTNKWICVSADQLRVVSYKDVIMLVMVSSQLAPGLADRLVKAFAETMSGTKVTDVSSVLTGKILSKG